MDNDNDDIYNEDSEYMENDTDDYNEDSEDMHN